MDQKQNTLRRPGKPADFGNGKKDHRAPRADRGSFRRDKDNRHGMDSRRSAGNRRGANERRSMDNRRPQGPSARDVALLAFRDVARSGAYAAQALDRRLRDAQLSDADRRLAASLFYFTVENWLRIEGLILERVKSRPEPEIMEIMDVAAAQLLFMDRVPDHAAVDEAVKQARRAGHESMTALVNGVLRNLIRARDAGEIQPPEGDAVQRISWQYSLRPELAQALIEAYGAATAEAITAWRPDHASESIRPNRLKFSDAEFEAWLDAQNLKWTRGVVPGAYRVADAGRLAAHEGYRKGLFSIQGESSMLAALAVSPRPGMQVLDACAAPGGKSCLMAEMMRGAGRVFAWDLHEHRVELIRAAARRLELDNIRPQVRDASKRSDALEGTLDAVLVDAPCSGVGVMGDKPDIKYRFRMEDARALEKVQTDILDACARLVRVGGLLVYSTCTILPGENRDQIAAFLERHSEFEPDNGEEWLPETLRGAYQGGMLQILPSRDGLDGFFIARLRRKADR